MIGLSISTRKPRREDGTEEILPGEALLSELSSGISIDIRNRHTEKTLYVKWRI